MTTINDDCPIAVAPKRAAKMLGIGITKLYELMAANEIDSYVDGGSRRVVVASIPRYVERRLAATADNKVRKSPRRSSTSEASV